MGIFLSQSPGIGGLDEVTDAEALFLQNITGLSYSAGDLLYHNGSDLVNLGIGTASQLLQTNAGADAPEWVTIAGGGDVSKVGTPVDSQVGVWTGDGTIEGTSGLTYDGSNFNLTGDIGITGTRVTKGWFTDLEVTNAINGSVTGNAGTVTNGVYTTDFPLNQNTTGSSGSCTGESATVATITGLAPDTATTQATQASITTCANLTTVGTIGTGVWEGTDVGIAHGGTGSSTLAGASIPTYTSTNTFTNKRITPRVVTTANDATAEIDIDVTDQYQLTAMSAATTFTVTGTPVAGQKLTVRLEDDGTTRGLTWNAVFRASSDLALPTDTTATKTMYCGFIYNLTDTKWDLVALLDNI